MSSGKGDEWGPMRAIRDLTCGSIAGVAQAYTGQPLDTVKVRIQTNPKYYRGTFDCIMKTVHKEGFMSLFSGVVPMATACLAENAVLLAGYGQCQALVRNVSGSMENGELSNGQLACAGMLSGVLAGLVLTPTELVKVRLQIQGLQSGGRVKMGPLGAARAIMRSDGFRGLYRGLTYTWMRDVPAYGVNFYAYEACRRALLKDGEKVGDLGPLRLILAGGTGGALSWASCYPLDVLKSRVQASSTHTPDLLTCFRHTLKHEGPGVFFRGMTPCVVRGFVVYGALFLTYEWSAKQYDYLTGRISFGDIGDQIVLSEQPL